MHLTPDDLVARARMRAWMRFLEEVATTAVRVPSFNMGFLPRFEGLDRKRFEAEQCDNRPVRKQFYRRMVSVGSGKKTWRPRWSNSAAPVRAWIKP